MASKRDVGALIAILAAAAAGVGCGAASAPASKAASAPVCPRGRATVIAIRHAEKVSAASDAELSPTGVERAERLAEMMANAGITRLVATDVRRTQQTLAPLAARTGKTVETRPARDVDGLARELKEAPDGAVVVVAHHSNGLPRLARALGAELRGVGGRDQLPENDYGRVLVFSLGCDRDRAGLVELSSTARGASEP